MKIGINGNIVNTKKIYSITRIENNYSQQGWYFEFEILSFNKKHSVYITSDYYNSNDKIIEIKLKNKLKIFRDSIIEVWSKNLSKIPQFNL